MSSKPIFRNNKAKSRYEMELDDKTAFIDYKKRETSNKMYLIHTEVPVELRNEGIAEKIVLSALMNIKAENLKLIPICPYIVTYIKRHPEWVSIVDESKKEMFL